MSTTIVETIRLPHIEATTWGQRHRLREERAAEVRRALGEDVTVGVDCLPAEEAP